ncbi:asparagine synthase (glutamine-hydrolyzing) [Roseomonas sp. M0104]|uniref:asparagine synthase (glutamine-hydrolyzing) n=1 Tax=Teichococcus coralli TaxID=2545983 RepID=A0A845B969_9PROT|nr:asparagine synthase (glutamine-hydrolyzing) [Pseudoroseomonas coralli]MXP63098.1 asparagine synthase (glutamine-hydrolyzing) [Pseudoroseomonas coralli]
MCGFVLSYSKVATDPESDRRFAAAAASIRHRGPDAFGECRIGPIAMAHCRLAIIDLDGGKQPMSTRDGQFWIAFNGEIYNHREIRGELEALGHVFAEHSDTEVLLRAWQQWGEACLHRLNGMFVFVVFDRERETITAARDRFGEKPLYICETAEALYLASELKALAVSGVAEKRLDPLALYSFLTLGYVTGEHSIFRNVGRLLPGHVLTYAPGTALEQRPWYQPPLPTDEIDDPEALVEQSLDLLRDSVRMRLVADVPVGCFLSGGVDSSAVLALAAEVADRPLEAFSVGFADARYDERPYARIVAQRYAARHHEFVLQPQSVEVLERIAWHADEPFADQAALPTWFLSELTSRHVKVALSGDGGDEFFAGYDVYRSHALSERVRRMPAPLRSLAVMALRKAAAAGTVRSLALLRLARNIEDAGLEAGERFMAKQQTVFRQAFLRQHVAPLALAEVPDCANPRLLREPGLHPLGAIAAWQQRVSLPDDMLHKVDRMSMAHALEVRTPFLDHRLGELMNRASFNAKMVGGRQKYILRKALERYLPADFLWRRKQGFVVPLSLWFKDDLAGFLRGRLLSPGAAVQGIVPRHTLELLLGEHARGTRDWGSALWALLMFELWCGAHGLTQENLSLEA